MKYFPKKRTEIILNRTCKSIESEGSVNYIVFYDPNIYIDSKKIDKSTADSWGITKSNSFYLKAIDSYFNYTETLTAIRIEERSLTEIESKLLRMPIKRLVNK